MIGAIIGDIVGSRFENSDPVPKGFEFFTQECKFTDDSAMSLAICDALMKCKPDFSDLSEKAVSSMQEIGNYYFKKLPFGGLFKGWLKDLKPRNSCGNGAAMRVSGCGYVGKTIEEVKLLSKVVTEVSHNHPEGLKGAEATAVAVFLARTGKSLVEIQEYIEKNYYSLDFNLSDIRKIFGFSDKCQGTVPPALKSFFESTDFETTIRNAVYLDGDTDTLAAIAGSVAEAYYGVPKFMREQAVSFLDDRLLKILHDFEDKYPPKIMN